MTVYSDEFKANKGRLAKLDAAERSRIAAKGGRATKGVKKVKYLRCSRCELGEECEEYVSDSNCHYMVVMRKRMSRGHFINSIEEIGFDNPKNFLIYLTNLLTQMREQVMQEDSKAMGQYIDRMIAFYKLVYSKPLKDY